MATRHRGHLSTKAQIPLNRTCYRPGRGPWTADTCRKGDFKQVVETFNLTESRLNWAQCRVPNFVDKPTTLTLSQTIMYRIVQHQIQSAPFLCSTFLNHISLLPLLIIKLSADNPNRTQKYWNRSVLKRCTFSEKVQKKIIWKTG